MLDLIEFLRKFCRAQWPHTSHWPLQFCIFAAEQGSSCQSLANLWYNTFLFQERCIFLWKKWFVFHTFLVSLLVAYICLVLFLFSFSFFKISVRHNKKGLGRQRSADSQEVYHRKQRFIAHDFAQTDLLAAGTHRRKWESFPSWKNKRFILLLNFRKQIDRQK